MAHNNAKVNIRLQEDTSNIAIENKKDGASMKTIAILGMIFLPGTFLAV
jgi:Mg2+ and Co2+ transporter CorA